MLYKLVNCIQSLLVCLVAFLSFVCCTLSACLPACLLDVWGNVADSLAESMLKLFVEFEAYETVLGFMRVNRDHKAVVGRVHRYELDNAARFALEESTPEDREKHRLERAAAAAERKAQRDALLLATEQRELEELAAAEDGEGVAAVADGQNDLLLLKESDPREAVDGAEINVILAVENAGKTEGEHKKHKKKHTRTLSAEKRAVKNKIRKWHFVPPAKDNPDPLEASDDSVGNLLETSGNDINSTSRQENTQEEAIPRADVVVVEVQPDMSIDESPGKSKPKRSASAERRAAKNRLRKGYSQKRESLSPSHGERPAKPSLQDHQHELTSSVGVGVGVEDELLYSAYASKGSLLPLDATITATHDNSTNYAMSNNNNNNKSSTMSSIMPSANEAQPLELPAIPNTNGMLPPVDPNTPNAKAKPTKSVHFPAIPGL